MTRITRHRLFTAPRDVVWEVVTDPNVYAEVAPNLSSVAILDGEGEGMIRECVDAKGNAWTESCHYWDPGREFAVAVDVETSDFHRPWFTRFEGRWRLADHDDGVVVTMQFDFDTGYGPLGAVLERYLRYRATPLIEAIFDGWTTEIEARLVETGPQTAPTESPEAETHIDQLHR
jgi:ribosome-associated toxin RatA of RatAB toxin-antitoxin module